MTLPPKGFASIPIPHGFPSLLGHAATIARPAVAAGHALSGWEPQDGRRDGPLLALGYEGPTRAIRLLQRVGPGALAEHQGIEAATVRDHPFHGVTLDADGTPVVAYERRDGTLGYLLWSHRATGFAAFVGGRGLAHDEAAAFIRALNAEVAS